MQERGISLQSLITFGSDSDICHDDNDDDDDGDQMVMMMMIVMVMVISN